MTKWFFNQARSAMSRERRRPPLGQVESAIVGVTLGVVIPAVLMVRDHRDNSRKPHSSLSIIGENLGYLAFSGGTGLLCSHRGWRGLALASGGTAVLLAPLGGRRPDPMTGEDWRDMAAFGAVGGSIVWALIRLVVRTI
jgi:hypothetical protein